MAKAKPVAVRAAQLCLMLLLSACVPEFVHPLSDPAKAKVDTRLVGLWSAKINNEEALFHFLPRADGWTDIVMVTYRGEREAGEWSVFRMFPSRIGEWEYMNVRFIAEASERSESERFFLVRYRLSPDDALTIWSMSGPAANSAIKAGLKGSVKKGQFGDDILIEAAPAELAAFLRRGDGNELFDNQVGPFRRLQF